MYGSWYGIECDNELAKKFVLYKNVRKETRFSKYKFPKNKSCFLFMPKSFMADEVMGSYNNLLEN